MVDRNRLTDATASFKAFAQREFDKAVRELIELAFRHKSAGADFLWDMEPGLDDEANRICRNLSDALAEKAKAIARSVADGETEYEDFENAWNRDGGILTRFDQQGSFLKWMLEVWVAVAFVNDITKGELRVMVSRYIANPFASPLWAGIPESVIKWGRGYQRNIPAQLTLIGQDAIVSAVRYAEWVDEANAGAKYYIRRRGSGYDCPECDELCGYPIPIDQPFETVHPRCMCWPEYHDE